MLFEIILFLFDSEYHIVTIWYNNLSADRIRESFIYDTFFNSSKLSLETSISGDNTLGIRVYFFKTLSDIFERIISLDFCKFKNQILEIFFYSCELWGFFCDFTSTWFYFIKFNNWYSWSSSTSWWRKSPLRRKDKSKRK